MKKKKSEKEPAPEKPAHELTTEEAVSRLFPKPLLDKVRHDLDVPAKPSKPSIQEA